VFKKIRSISYDSGIFDGHGFDARYATDTGIELRMRGFLEGVAPEALASVDTDRYAKLWGLASFGHVFGGLLPIRLEVNAFSLEPAEEERWRAWLLRSLSEHFHLTGLPAEIDLTFSGERLAARSRAAGLGERAILMSGGGKDSAVSAELLKSLGIPFDWYAFSSHTQKSGKQDPSRRGIAEIAGDSPLITGTSRFGFKAPGDTDFKRAGKRLRRRYFLHRKRYRKMNWLSLMSQMVQACMVAEATGSRYVLTGSERSANEGIGIHVGAVEVNHQYMKTYAFEREFAPFLAKYLHPELKYAGLLVPLYELQIGKLFASYPQYFSTFRSCNRRTAKRPWCLECPKCAFVFLLMSAFVDEERISRIFHADLLADPRHTGLFKDLCGRGGQKPLECVGVQEESLLALYLASRRRTATPLHSDLAAILPDAAEADELSKRILNAYNDENGLPPHWNERLRELI